MTTKTGVIKKKTRRRRKTEMHPRFAAEKRANDLRNTPPTPRQNAINIERTLPNLIQRLPRMSMADLGRVWRNAIKIIDGPNAGAANRAVVAIEQEWEKRGANASPQDYFAWPSTNAPGGNGDLHLAGLPKEGMLRYLEYQVGRSNGQSSPVRQAILRRVFEGILPPVFPKPYMMEWGPPKSSHRLRKTAESIAAFACLFKRRHDARYDDAISDWEADLQFLYDEYYVGRFGFGWPSTHLSL